MWSLYFYLYSSKDNDDREVQKVLNRLTNNRSQSVDLYILIQYKNSVKLDILTSHLIFTKELQYDKPDKLLKQLLSYSSNSLRAIFFSGHCSLDYLQVTDNSIFHIGQLESILLNFDPFDLIVFDCCSMATLEVAYQLRNISPYIIACQDYMGWIGFIGSNLIDIFKISSPILVAQQLIKQYLMVESYPTDAVLIDTQLIEELVYSLQECESISLAQQAHVADNAYDIYLLISQSNVSDEIKNWINQLLDNIVIYYQSNHTGWYGLSIKGETLKMLIDS